MILRSSAASTASFIPGGVGFGADVHTVKAGLNYRFGWGGPVAARY
jgi:outer membrane immunogenic protein